MIEGKVVVVGAGIGGLSLACALHQSGRDVAVLDASLGLPRNGGGIFVHSSGLSALREMGLEGRVLDAGQIVDSATVCTYRGRTLTSTRPGLLARSFGAPSVALPRARLQQVFLDALPSHIVRVGFDVVTYEEDAHRIVAITDGGRRVEGTILVGADGLRSRIRSRLIGDGPPRFAGYTSWRGVANVDDVLAPGVANESWGDGQRFGFVAMGRGQVSWFATANASAGERDPIDVVGALRARFRGWHDPIDELIARTEPSQIVRNDVHDRTPIRRWCDGRVALLGDAAHPMTPNLALGACQAIEDALVFSRALRGDHDVAGVFREYEAIRVAPANQLLLRSRNFGRVAQWTGRTRRFLRDAAVRLTPETLSPLFAFGV